MNICFILESQEGRNDGWHALVHRVQPIIFLYSWLINCLSSNISFLDMNFCFILESQEGRRRRRRCKSDRSRSILIESVVMASSDGAPRMFCFSVDQIVLNGIWRKNLNFSSYAVPMFYLQICCFVSSARLLAYLIKPLKQPKVVAEILIFSSKVYNILLLGILAVTVIASPLALLTHRPPRRHVAYKRRNLQRSRLDDELRMVACVHTTRNVPSIINLLEVSNPTKRSPIFVYALHLIELSGRASAMLIVHNPIQTNPGGHNRKGGTSRARGGHGGGQQQSEQIITAFENYEQHAGGVSIQPLTAVSPYSSMHEDICSIAEDRHAALIVLPFHKVHTVGGDLETINPGIQSVNQKVLANAPCSVAILVDRGLGAGATKYAGSRHVAHNVALLFFGGPDDREALAYAWRMAEHPGITLTVVRFLPGADTSAAAAAKYSASSMSRTSASDSLEPMAVVVEEDVEWRLDDEFVNEFRLKNVGVDSVVYTEKVVSNSEETVGAIRSMETIHDLYVVGRGHRTETPLTAGLAEWSEFPELGSIGDLLASSDFGATASVLVVQQYIVHGFGGGMAEQPAAPESPRQSVLQYLSKANHRASRPASAAVDAGWNGAGYRYSYATLIILNF